MQKRMHSVYMYIYTYITNTYIHLARLDVYIYIHISYRYTYRYDKDVSRVALVTHQQQKHYPLSVPGIFGRQTLTFSGGFIPGIHQYSAEAFVPQLQMSGEPTSGDLVNPPALRIGHI